MEPFSEDEIRRQWPLLLLAKARRVHPGDESQQQAFFHATLTAIIGGGLQHCRANVLKHLGDEVELRMLQQDILKPK